MTKIECSDYVFLQGIATQIENGENLERALFNIKFLPDELLLRLQFGDELIRVLSSIDFNYPSMISLFSSINYSDSSDILKKVKITARLIKNREEAIQEKENLLKIHQRRIKIIRYVTSVTIAMIGGFSPIFANIYRFMQTNEFLNTPSFWSFLSVSFLFINLLNNYFLLKIGNEKNIKIRLIITLVLHFLIVFAVRIFYSNFFVFS
ncbi:MAG: hypothetical protein H7641_07360 [Candidatus Heimdallarchaeota archaeon]|nr:hypothetical protein [Candidatus Heimdallarchaeota archaeon]MCK4877381.1 hypothetical protein [Candidatus Heimdallarchaeota archaeon]